MNKGIKGSFARSAMEFYPHCLTKIGSTGETPIESHVLTYEGLGDHCKVTISSLKKCGSVINRSDTDCGLVIYDSSKNTKDDLLDLKNNPFSFEADHVLAVYCVGGGMEVKFEL